MTQFSFLNSLQEAAGALQADLKSADMTDAGKYDVADKAQGIKDVSFSSMRNTINADGEITGSDVADYIEKAEELNDEIDTVAYGLETDDGNIVKVYVNAEQSEAFEAALSNMLGIEEDIEETINKLAAEYDIIDVVWPEDPNDSGIIAPPEDEDGNGEPLPGDNENELENQLLGLQPNSILGPEDDGDDDFEVIAALPGIEPSQFGNAVPTPTELAGDASGAIPGDGTEDVESLPDVPEDEEVDIMSRLNDRAIEMFGQEDDSEVMGLRDLQPDQLGQLIKLADADEIAVNQYDAADFLSLEEDEQREILTANPDLVIDQDEDDGDEGAAVDVEAAVDKAGGEDVEQEVNINQDDESPVPESKKTRFSLLSML